MMKMWGWGLDRLGKCLTTDEAMVMMMMMSLTIDYHEMMKKRQVQRKWGVIGQAKVRWCCYASKEL